MRVPLPESAILTCCFDIVQFQYKLYPLHEVNDVPGCSCHDVVLIWVVAFNADSDGEGICCITSERKADRDALWNTALDLVLMSYLKL